MQLNCSGMFSRWCSQLWMDIMFLYLLMDKPTLEKQWLLSSSFSIYLSTSKCTCLCVSSLYLHACDASFLSVHADLYMHENVLPCELI